MNVVIFDLDGTISDPADGITRSINYALVELGYEARRQEELLKYIGPHLSVTFADLTGTKDESTLSRAIALYRKRYISIGYRENYLYDGILDILSFLASNVSVLCVATSKREDIALQVLNYFKIDRFFAKVYGCDVHRSKTDLLRDILFDSELKNKPMIMVGDREGDFLAASAVNMPSIAVRWGYGEEGELAQATAVVEKPSQLPETIAEYAQHVTLPESNGAANHCLR